MFPVRPTFTDGIFKKFYASAADVPGADTFIVNKEWVFCENRWRIATACYFSTPWISGFDGRHSRSD
jgi:hypothetical protein